MPTTFIGGHRAHPAFAPQTELLVRDIGRGPVEADRASQRTAPRSGHLTGTAATAARPPGEARHARGPNRRAHLSSFQVGLTWGSRMASSRLLP